MPLWIEELKLSWLRVKRSCLLWCFTAAFGDGSLSSMCVCVFIQSQLWCSTPGHRAPPAAELRFNQSASHLHYVTSCGCWWVVRAFNIVFALVTFDWHRSTVHWVLDEHDYASFDDGQRHSFTLSFFWFLFGLSGVLDSSGSTSETSIMSFLSAMESRSLQAGPVSASLLPPFRPPSWPAGKDVYIQLVLCLHTHFSILAHTQVFQVISLLFNSVKHE